VCENNGTKSGLGGGGGDETPNAADYGADTENGVYCNKTLQNKICCLVVTRES